MTHLNVTNQLIEGSTLISDVVSSTLGPRGRLVIIQAPYGVPHPTKDGVTVANNVSSQDKVSSLAVELIRQAASKTASSQGDGTTTTVILTDALFKEANRLLSLGYSLPLIKRQFRALADELIKAIEELSIQVTKEDLKKIVYISSSQDEEITNQINEALSKLSTSAVITLKESSKSYSFVEISPGYTIERSYITPHFQVEHLEDVYVLVTDHTLSSSQDILPILSLAHSINKPLLLIASDIEGPALATLTINHLQKRVNILPLRAPSYGENRMSLLEDIATITSAKFISSSTTPVSQITKEDLGYTASLSASKDKVTLLNPKKSPSINERIKQLEQELSLLEEDSFFHNQLLSRIGNLKSEVAVIHIWAHSESALKEKKYRYEDALRALYSAIKGGYVAGAFSSIIHSLPKSDEIITSSFKKALLTPFKILCHNASVDYSTTLSEILSKEYPYGLNLSSPYTHSVDDLISKGVIDPTSVITTAISVSVDTALILASTSHAITQDKPSYQPSLEDGSEPG